MQKFESRELVAKRAGRKGVGQAWDVEELDQIQESVECFDYTSWVANWREAENDVEFNCGRNRNGYLSLHQQSTDLVKFTPRPKR